ncbi:MAG: aspartate kinase [Myxococcota bacterium]
MTSSVASGWDCAVIVMKFGGSSLADAEQVRKVGRIVEAALERQPVVVCSAHKGITDGLIAAARRAAQGDVDASSVIERQRQILVDLDGEPSLLDAFYRDLTDMLRGISLVREVSPRVLDFIQSFGERMSVRTVASHLSKVGIAAMPFDAFDLGFVTDTNFNQARPLEGFEQRMRDAFAARVPAKTVAVITGFVGKTAAGEITTVGRNGSDFSASCFAAGLGAEECQIWTDTDGVMTCDPRLVADARNIPAMSFAEAGELARYGGRVLHPSTLVPAVKANIPVRVLNTNHPDHPGTVITKDGGSSTAPFTSIAYKEGQAVITIESPGMLGQYGFLARVFDVVGQHEIDIDMVSTSEISVSMTTSGHADLASVVRALGAHGVVTVAENKSLVCIVGRRITQQTGVAAQVFAALSDAGVNVEMISHGANNINLSIMVDDDQVNRAVTALHTALFSSSR